MALDSLFRRIAAPRFPPLRNSEFKRINPSDYLSRAIVTPFIVMAAENLRREAVSKRGSIKEQAQRRESRAFPITLSTSVITSERLDSRKRFLRTSDTIAGNRVKNVESVACCLFPVEIKESAAL